ncbi:NAD(P)/FAD-dependent oxidoreductase [Melaminivora sp.]|uniref:NAD(P)/FAD-dependent oxidoreductase n=1 Tax=Melaminivora sp. TaxID=1933032 RepID=UPI0028ADE2EE|nr:NAD(P)/FAD-dependent oxidoreductase [Melaminivora sp.]
MPTHPASSRSGASGADASAGPAAAAPPAEVDAVIIGGGPAGLTAALYLARFRRSVLLLDAAQSRLSKIPRSHNYPGFAEGVTGTDLLAMLREQTLRYPVHAVTAYVDTVERRGDGFEVGWAGGSARARQVLLATGVTDIPPAMPYVLEALRAGVLRYCPVCDGYEAIDQAVGVIADGEAGVGEALYLRHFTPHITLFMEQGAAALDEGARRRLAEAGIAWADEPIDSIRHWEERITVRHGQRETVCDSLYCALGLDIHASLARRLGARTNDDGYLVIDDHHATTVPGLWAAGDVSQGLNQITVAMAGGAIAAAAMHRRL